MTDTPDRPDRYPEEQQSTEESHPEQEERSPSENEDVSISDEMPVTKETENNEDEIESDFSESDSYEQNVSEVEEVEDAELQKDEDPSAPVQKTALEKIFNALSFFPMLTLFILMALQTMFLLDARELWFSDEVRYANVFEHLLHAKKWIVLYLNGIPYPDKPPVYFWLLKAIYMVIGEVSPKLFMLGAAVSGVFVTWATYVMARVMGEDKKTGFAAGLILLSCFYFLGVTHYSRMDLLFATLITLSHVCLFKGWQKDKSYAWVFLGFAFAGLATLTKGPLGIAFPFASMLLFNIWRWKLRRLGGWDVALGFGLFLVICFAWVGAAYLTEDHDYLRNIFQQQIIRRATNTWHHGQPWWHYFATLPAAWAPWTLILLVLPWGKLFTGAFYKNIWNSRKPENMGAAYLWITVLSGFAILSAVSIKIVIYLLPLFPPLAILTARGLKSLSPIRSKVLFRLFSLLLIAIGGGVIAVQFHFNPWHITIDGWYILAGLAFLFAVLLWKCDTSRPTGGLLALTIFLLIWLQPLGKITAPSLDKVMSPAAQAKVMQEYILNGFHAISYKIYSGTYTYYAGENIEEAGEMPQLEAALEAHDNIAVAIRKKHWDEWKNRPEDLHIVHRQYIVDHQPRNEYLLAVRRTDEMLATPPTAEESLKESANDDAPSDLTVEKKQAHAPAPVEQKAGQNAVSSDNSAACPPETVQTPPEPEPGSESTLAVPPESHD